HSRSLCLQLYYHAEPISVNVHVTNNSTKTVKKIKISVRQYADICLFSTAQYKCPVAQVEADDQVSASSTFCKVYTLVPLLDHNREKRGLALDGKLKHEDTNLASSTMDVSVELPFVLMHPKPVEQPMSRPQSVLPESEVPVDMNLIEFEANFSNVSLHLIVIFQHLPDFGLSDPESFIHLPFGKANGESM
ncbi:arrestin red cell-like, partial [Chiloscyllium plagiosum]|uniref:arrestin red cell-like n=1 Tax=Chiloscyllium plagiosum TaxID=36176 RepID=UPI001CB84329